MAKRTITTAILVIASIILAGCGDKKRKARVETGVSAAEVSTELPPSEVSDDFLRATAQVAADAVSVPHAVEVVAPEGAVAIPPAPVLPPPMDNGSNVAANMSQMPMANDSASNVASNAATNAQ